MLYLSEADVRAVLSMPMLVDEIDASLRHEAAGTARAAERITLSLSGGGSLRLMGATISTADVMGFKVFNKSANGVVRYLVGVYSEYSGDPLALVESAYLTAARTGATTGVAARYLLPGSACRAAVIGSGLEARTNLRALACVVGLTEVLVFSPNPVNRAAFAEEMGLELGTAIIAVDTAEKAVTDADVVLTATNTGSGQARIACELDWLSPGTKVLSIGSTTPVGRELDERILLAADLVAMDAPAQAAYESGDVVAAIASGFDNERTVALSDLVRGAVPRPDNASRVVFKSVGTAVQDVTAAHAVYREARRRGLGIEIEMTGKKQFTFSEGKSE